MKRALLAACCLVACSGGGDGVGKSGPGDGATTPDPSSISAYVDAFCSLARTCCGRAAFPAAPLATCEGDVVSQTHVLQSAMAGTVTVNPAAMQACTAALRSAANSCSVTVDLSTECSGVFSGTVADGAPCRTADECTRSGTDAVICVKVSTSAVSSPEKGVCHPLVRGASGSPCLFSASGNFAGSTYTSADPNPVLVFCHDADGLRCSPPSRTCAPLVNEGGACGGDQMCRSDLYCDTTCRLKKSEGAACTTSNECGGPTNCVDGTCKAIQVATNKLCGGDYN